MEEHGAMGILQSRIRRTSTPHGQSHIASPSAFYPSHHQYAFFLHDALVGLIRDGERANLFTTRFRFKSEGDAKVFEALDDAAKWEWLWSGTYRWVLGDLVYRQVTVALLSDLCHFVYEALQCAWKGKYTVAYALLRKPFAENLLYLEWLLCDPSDFLLRYLTDSPGSLDLSCRVVNEARRREIITGALQSSRSGEWVTPAFMYRLRYDDGCTPGLSAVCKQALHLITTHRAESMTDPQNFNFVFSAEESLETQARHFYWIVPFMLFHTVEVAEALVGRLIPVWTDQVRARRLVGFILWARLVLAEWGSEPPDSRLVGSQVECPKCGKPTVLSAGHLFRFYQSGWFRCRRCLRRVSFKGL